MNNGCFFDIFFQLFMLTTLARDATSCSRLSLVDNDNDDDDATVEDASLGYAGGSVGDSSKRRKLDAESWITNETVRALLVDWATSSAIEYCFESTMSTTERNTVQRVVDELGLSMRTTNAGLVVSKAPKLRSSSTASTSLRAPPTLSDESMRPSPYTAHVVCLGPSGVPFAVRVTKQ